MQLKWLGHSCFLLTSDSGRRVLMDPPDPSTGYSIALQEADILTTSHDHHDHCYTALAKGSPALINTPGNHTVQGVGITGVPTWHDEAQGGQRGQNIMFLVEMDGIRVLHAGDLGHVPGEGAAAAAGRVDVLLLPVGGVYTVDYAGAHGVIAVLKPSVVVPMHYKTPACAFGLGELAPFLDMASGWAIHRVRESWVSLSPESLGSGRILVLEYD